MKIFNGELKLKKKIKLKDGTLNWHVSKVWVPTLKSDERSRVISKVFPTFVLQFIFQRHYALSIN
jgi:hypothetical protein